MASKTNEQVVTETFSERSAFADGMTAAGASAGAGLLVSAIQNSVQTHNKGALGVFTRTGSTIALFTAMGGIFSYTDSTVANFRQKDDAVNGAIGGCAAGFVLGAAARSVPMMFGGCASLAALIGTFDAAGKSLQGTYARASATDFSHGHDAAPGTPGWREAREARRQSFFKQKKEDVESDA
ncbi:Complex I-B14.7 [Pseudozyma hubeiensis]|nr:Complex I-B14.7 [Pseudozyma hubeiensis]